MNRVVMPQLGANDDLVTVVQWLVQPGERVAAGQAIAVVETSKAQLELEAEAAGHFYPVVTAGEQVSVRDVVALILDAPDQALAAQAIEELRPSETEDERLAGLQLTVRARALLAAAPDLDVSSLPTDRLLRERDVAALIDRPEAPMPAGDAARRIAVYGASEGGISVAEAIQAMGGCEIACFLDDTPEKAGTTLFGLPVRPGDELEDLPREGIGALATHIADRAFRIALRDRALAAGFALPAIIHPAAWVAPSARLGHGCVVKAGARIDSQARLGDVCIVDNGALVPHHNVIGDGCHLAPGVAMGGGCVLGPRTLVGVGAVISPRIRLGADVIVAPGAVVVRDVPDAVVVEGHPAHVIGTRR